jgi:ATP synthase protein I
MSDDAPDPENLRRLGTRIDEVQRRKRSAAKDRPPPTQMGIAFRFSTELVSALVVGGGIGWGLDWLFGTRPILIVVFFVLGAAAGILNVMRAAKEINAEMTAKNLEK